MTRPDLFGRQLSDVVIGIVAAVTRFLIAWPLTKRCRISHDLLRHVDNARSFGCVWLLVGK